jgi:hypothetical protein
MDCADGYVEFCFPRLAAWMADTTEQSLLTSVIGGFCPVCAEPKENLGKELEVWPRREPRKSRKKKETCDDKEK